MLHEHISLLHVKRLDDALGFLCAVNQDLSVSGKIVAFNADFGELLLQQGDLVRVAFLLGLKVLGMFFLALS